MTPPPIQTPTKKTSKFKPLLKSLKNLVILFFSSNTREAANRIACVRFYKLDYPQLYTLLPIVLGIRNVFPEIKDKEEKNLNVSKM